VSVHVKFSLPQEQTFINGLASQQAAIGDIQFDTASDAAAVFNSPGNKTLRGGGIQALVVVNKMKSPEETAGSFRVTGTVKDI
jgi:hypothetical protein